ncbi:LytR/AlgR family response regulator transcription factor [Butyrivibrio sp. INlla14]|uniref:LytR/AlgR family response regulator transcription factor n=1 Tax=Butyrivibrio sp. INlla14 TaxID=1520808 RepID=UPI0008772D1D|nr:LytTR family DNA-binding domain-containing protein [Butyrivibrio sp. INlla14]SCY11260.1 two component transcriptional regulator, LytTR family [Butyrivibrio sp. INlla14]
MRIIVCDDEPAIRNQVKKLVLQENEGAEVRLCKSAEEVLKNPDADLLYLDIQLGEMSGIEAAKQLRSAGNNTPVIFISGIKDYIYEAFDVGAFWYLIKPIEREQFHHVYEKAVAEITKHNEVKSETLLFTTRKKNYSLSRDQIIYVENAGKKVIMHTTTGNIEIYASMAEMEERLGRAFFRCHRGFLVNMNHISSYSGEGISMSNGKNVFLARERYRDFVEGYMGFLENDL